MPVPHRRHQQHVRAVLLRTHLEVVVHPLPEHRGRERTERLPELDLAVHHRLHVAAAGVAEDAARAEGARPELHAALEPADHLLARQQVRDRLAERRVVRVLLVDRAGPVQEAPDTVVRRPRSEQRPALRVRRPDLPRVVEELMPDEQRHAERAARVSRRRLDPHVVEGPLAQHPSVPDAVQRHAAGEAEVAHPRLRVHVARRPQHRLLGDRLNGRRDVHLPLRDRRLGLPRRPAEERVELVRRHPQPLAVLEVRHVQAERSVRLQIDQVVPDALDVLRLAVRRQPHQLVLAGVDLEAGEVGEGGVQQPERMREADLVRQLDAVAVPDAVRRRGPLPDPVQRQNGRLVERRRKERTGRVRLVVLREDDLSAVAAQPARDLARQVELLLRPQRHEPEKGSENPRGA